MLRRLHIRNFLLIEEADLHLDPGFTVITGETGSGKSILLGALALAMGERADTSAFRDARQRCVIELEVDLGRLDLRAWFEAQELPYERHAILRRQLEPGGRSRAFVNDTPVRLEQLRELAAGLVHVHSQHHTLLLNDPRFQLGLVDHVAGQVDQVQALARAHASWRAVQHTLKSAREEEARAAAEQEFLRFQLDELQLAALQDGEQERLEAAQAIAAHAEELTRGLGAVELLVHGEGGILELMARCKQELQRPARYDQRIKALLERLEGVHIELNDMGQEAGQLAGAVDMDPREAARLQERLDMLLRLQQKHRVHDVAGLIALRDELQGRLGRIAAMDEHISVLAEREAALGATLLELAWSVSGVRSTSMPPLSKQVEAILRELGMPHARFEFRHEVSEMAGPHGLDHIRALFSANPDRSLAPLDKVASGGELGRVMLALISLAADSRGLPTVIFDEVDTGVSGEVADRVGSLMARMGRDRQVIAITHLPQIAGKADQHLQVSKSAMDDRVRTSIDPLIGERRIEAIARMLSGRKVTKVAMENARVLLGGDR